PVKAVEIEVVELAVKGWPTQRLHKIAGVLVANTLSPVALIGWRTCADVVPPVVDAAIQDQGVETLDRRIAEHREVKLRIAIIAFEIYTEGVLGVFGGVALGAALDLQAA